MIMPASPTRHRSPVPVSIAINACSTVAFTGTADASSTLHDLGRKQNLPSTVLTQLDERTAKILGVHAERHAHGQDGADAPL